MLHPAFLDGQAGLGQDSQFAPLFFQHPAYRMPVDITGDVPRLIERPSREWSAPFPLFLKLGAKSWRDCGTLRTISEQQGFLPCVEALFSRLSERQKRYLSLVRPFHDRLDLSLFRYVDFSDISEARWLVQRGRVVFSSCCLRGSSAEHARAGHHRMRDLAALIGAALGVDAIVDLALRPCGTISILEINPSPGDLAFKSGGRGVQSSVK
jgi:hypothetical protein